MSNPFDSVKAKEDTLFVTALDADVMVRELTINEHTAMFADFGGSDDVNEMFELQKQIVSKVLIEPKMSVEELGSLSHLAREAITEIFVYATKAGNDSGKT